MEAVDAVLYLIVGAALPLLTSLTELPLAVIAAALEYIVLARGLNSPRVTGDTVTVTDGTVTGADGNVAGGADGVTGAGGCCVTDSAKF